jgi:glycosyltransferase involved in cell wall biosynthesis
MSNSNIKMSIIMPVYNAAEHLEHSFEQLFDQGFCADEFEIICVNDASPDGSLEICQKFAAAHSQVCVISLAQNSGAAVARNTGIDQARGQYVYFFDADDEIAPDALSKLYAMATEHQLDALCFSGWLKYENPQLEQTSPQDPAYFTRATDVLDLSGKQLLTYQIDNGDFCAQPCFHITRNALLQQHKIRFPEGMVNEDNQLVLETLLLAPHAGQITEKFYTYWVRPGSVTVDVSRGAKRFQAHVRLSEWCRNQARAALLRGEAPLACALAYMDSWYVDCALETYAQLDELPRVPELSCCSDVDYNKFYRPLFDAQKQLARAQAEVARLEAENQQLKARAQSPLDKLRQKITRP